MHLFYQRFYQDAGGRRSLLKNRDHGFLLSYLSYFCRFLNLFGDLEDLQTALKQGTKLLGSGSCSALIKLLPNYQDLYVSHDTWNEYNGMLRIIKKTTLNFKDQQGRIS